MWAVKLPIFLEFNFYKFFKYFSIINSDKNFHLRKKINLIVKNFSTTIIFLNFMKMLTYVMPGQNRIFSFFSLYSLCSQKSKKLWLLFFIFFLQCGGTRVLMDCLAFNGIEKWIKREKEHFWWMYINLNHVTLTHKSDLCFQIQLTSVITYRTHSTFKHKGRDSWENKETIRWVRQEALESKFY